MALISRRNLLSVGAAAGAAALLPRRLLAFSGTPRSSAPRPATLSAGGLLAVTPVSDPSSVTVVDRLFPGLLADDGFQQLRSMSFLVTNLTNHAIRAFSSRWILTAPGGSREMTIMHYFHPRAGRLGRKRMHWGMKGDRTRLTGKVPIIKRGATRLVTPFFNWSPKFYKVHGTPDWAELFRDRARPEVRLSSLTSPGTGVTMTIVAAITHDYAAVGPQSEDLARVFSVTRNAEHDEAVSVLRQVSAGASPAEVRNHLRRDASGLAFDIQATSDLYYRVRQRQAKVLLRRLEKARWDRFQRTLQYLANQPETQIRKLDSVSPDACIT